MIAKPLNRYQAKISEIMKKQPYFTTTDSTEPGVTEAELAVRANVAAPANK